MFDLSFAEIFFVIIVTLLVCKPEDIPVIVRNVTQFFEAIKSYCSELSKELTDIKKDVDIRDEVTGHIRDLEGNLQKTYDVSELETLYHNPIEDTKKEGDKDA